MRIPTRTLSPVVPFTCVVNSNQPCLVPHPPVGPTANGDQTRISLPELLLLKSADLGLSKAIGGTRMRIELEDDRSYEIFPFIYHSFVCLLAAAAVNLLVTSGTFKLGHAGRDKEN